MPICRYATFKFEQPVEVLGIIICNRFYNRHNYHYKYIQVVVSDDIEGLGKYSRWQRGKTKDIFRILQILP